MTTDPHTHAWETFQRCFECDAVREWEPDAPAPASTPCPSDPIREAETTRLISDLAGCDWRGKDVTLKNLIFNARKLAGWPRTSWTK